MKSIFLSPEQLFDKPLPMFTTIGTEARASDLAVLTAPDDGFLLEGSSINYYIGEDASVDRFGRLVPCKVCAVRPVLLLEEGEENLLRRRKEEGNVVTVEFGFPAGDGRAGIPARLPAADRADHPCCREAADGLAVRCETHDSRRGRAWRD